MRITILILTMLLLSSCSITKVNQKPFLEVERNDPLNNLGKNASFNKTIDNVEQIKTLIDYIEKLPPFPKELIHCPMDNGVNYDLKFNRIYNNNVVNVNATGCRQVKLNDKVYRAIDPNGQEFRDYLIKILGLSEEEFTRLSK
ncbi:hypothetical protein [Gorillibacterium massiliense]|uniref:hypothetical protein n=1 Tax=Gorillibacterium massiliense TaxID=1280390 RepID=UPI000594681C|nr:hypothetical protein [Gorillibacterium massiliense]